MTTILDSYLKDLREVVNIEGGSANIEGVTRVAEIKIDTRRWNDEDGRELDDAIAALAARSWGFY